MVAQDQIYKSMDNNSGYEVYYYVEEPPEDDEVQVSKHRSRYTCEPLSDMPCVTVSIPFLENRCTLIKTSRPGRNHGTSPKAKKNLPKNPATMDKTIKQQKSLKKPTKPTQKAVLIEERQFSLI
jgi:hypothetical protein